MRAQHTLAGHMLRHSHRCLHGRIGESRKKRRDGAEVEGGWLGEEREEEGGGEGENDWEKREGERERVVEERDGVVEGEKESCHEGVDKYFVVARYVVERDCN